MTPAMTPWIVNHHVYSKATMNSTVRNEAILCTLTELIDSITFSIGTFRDLFTIDRSGWGNSPLLKELDVTEPVKEHLVGHYE